ncbi:MAG: hypothetical protein ABUS57_00495 [Pseudomonadota bacterium]
MMDEPTLAQALEIAKQARHDLDCIRSRIVPLDLVAAAESEEFLEALDIARIAARRFELELALSHGLALEPEPETPLGGEHG